MRMPTVAAVMPVLALVTAALATTPGADAVPLSEQEVPAGRIAFVARTSQGYDIFTAATDGSARVRLTRDGASFSPAWSPDGHRILFRRDDARNRATIWVMDHDGADKRAVLRRPVDDWYPSWAPNGRRFVFSRCLRSCRTWDLFIYSFATQRTRRVTRNEQAPGGWYASHRPAWSPNGRRIMFLREGPGRRTGETEVDIFTVRPDGRRLRKLLNPRRDALDADWSPTGRHVAYQLHDVDRPRSGCRKRIRVLDVRTGAVRKTPARPPRAGCALLVSWAPPGSTIAYLTHFPRSERTEIRYARRNGELRGTRLRDALQPDWGTPP